MKRTLRELKVLLLEDVPTDAELIERELKRNQIWYRALRVEDQPSFEKALDEFKPDLILADYNLPSFDGITALRIAHNRVPDIPFIFVSGGIGEDRAVEALRHGAVDYIIKDRMQRLGPAVLRALEEVTARVERQRADAALRVSEERFRIVASATTDGIWDWQVDSGAVWLSPSLRNLFSYGDAPEHVTIDWILSRIHPDEAPMVRNDMAQLAGGGGEFAAHDYRFRRGDGVYAHVHQRARVVRTESSGSRVVAALSDITDQVVANRRQAAQFSITRVLAEAETIESAIPRILEGWCDTLGADVGALWLTDKATEELECYGVWQRETDTDNQFAVASRSARFRAGQGLPGQVWQRCQPVFVDNLDLEKSFARAAATWNERLREAFAFPITSGNLCLGVVEGFSRTQGIFDRSLAQLAGDIGSQIGQFLQRKRAEEALQYRVEAERIISDLSTHFINLPIEHVDHAIDQSLEALCEFTAADRAYVYLFSGMATLSNTHEAVAPGITKEKPNLQNLPQSQFRWVMDKLRARDAIVVNRLVDLPPESAPLRQALEEQQVQSTVNVPIVAENAVIGFVGLDAVRTERVWTSDEVTLLRLIGDILGNALSRRKKEEELRKSESLLAFAQRQAHLGSFERYVESDTVTWSDELYRIFSVDPKEFTPTLDAILEMIHPEDRERMGPVITGPASGSFDHRIIRADGSVRFVHSTKETFYDDEGRPVRVVGSILDVTELREATATIGRLSRQQQLILSSVGDGIFGIDRDGIATFVNPAAARMLGWNADELIGRKIHEVIHYAREDGSPYPWRECPLNQALQHGTTISTENELFWTKDGTPVQIACTATPLLDEAGSRVGAVKTFRDISERRLLERQLEQANRLTSLGRLAATIAHEFNNVLMGIQPFNELIRKHAGSDPKIEKATDQIGRSVQRGKGITQQILRYTRPAQPNMQEIPLDEWLNDFVSEMRGVVGESITVNLAPIPDGLSLRGDPLQLLQVFSNIVVNARDAMPRGGSVTITAEPPSLRSIYSFGVVPEPERLVHISVSDTGPGMTRETLEKIFEPLFTTKKTGTGLGLAVVHQIVQQHGGAIFADSELGKGTTFHVFLPHGKSLPAPNPQVPPLASARPEGDEAELAT